MIDRICVIGHPSLVGGADTELDHQIRCWLQMGLKVHICPTGSPDEVQCAMQLEDRGCIYHASRDWKSLEGMHCISFCNDVFLSELVEIHKYARTTTFVNCMTWNFPQELKMQEMGHIDFHLYQTKHAFDRVSQKLRPLGDYTPYFFTPYFFADDFPYIDDRKQDCFRFGRISRSDADKFGARQLWIYRTMTAPVLKEGLILGWNSSIEAKFGEKPESYIRTLPAGAISQRAFYSQCEAIIMTTDTFENLPRVAFEAMASGSVLIVDNRGGWKQQIEDGVTGWLCMDDREFVYKASRCAFEHSERNAMRAAARARLDVTWGLQAAMDSWAQVFKAWDAA